jgi:hypothetical protein
MVNDCAPGRRAHAPVAREIDLDAGSQAIPVAMLGRAVREGHYSKDLTSEERVNKHRRRVALATRRVVRCPDTGLVRGLAAPAGTNRVLDVAQRESTAEPM